MALMRPCIDCGVPSVGTRCLTHTRQHDATRRPSPDARYGPGRKARHAAYYGQPCALALPGCTGIATTADHGPDGLRPACHHCNSADGGTRSHSTRM